MTKGKRALLAIFLLLAFGIWVFFTIFTFNSSSDNGGGASRPRSVYEPKFKDEGDLFFISGEDTIKKIDIEIADEADEIQFGLMYRKKMDEDKGMLFFMDKEEIQSFWMKNTYIPLDIIYINSKNEIVSIQKNARPLNETSLPSEAPASLVLEVNAGFTDQYNLTKGDRIAFAR